MPNDWGWPSSVGTCPATISVYSTDPANVTVYAIDMGSGAVLPGLEHPEPGGYIEGDKQAADADSGAWPQSGRNRAASFR